MKMKKAVFRTTGGRTSTYRCKKCGDLHPLKRNVKATVETTRVISCGMCGEKHRADAKCNTVDWLRHRTRRLRGQPKKRPRALAETGRTGRSAHQPSDVWSGPYTTALQYKSQSVTPEEREREGREREHRESLIETILSVWGAMLTEDDLRSLPIDQLEEMAARAREQSNDARAARAAGLSDYVPAPFPYTIALARRAAGGAR